jgi:hypothetical protein
MNRISFLFSLSAFAALLCGPGCVNTRVIENTRTPEIVVDAFGAITFNDKRIELKKLARAVKAAGITRDQEVNILVPERFDPALRSQIYAEMLRGGYTRTIFVTSRKATSLVTGKEP